MVKILQASMTGVVTAQQIALLGLYSEDLLYRAVAKGDILAYRPTPGKLFIDWKDFCKFLHKNPTIIKETE